MQSRPNVPKLYFGRTPLQWAVIGALLGIAIYAALGL